MGMFVSWAKCAKKTLTWRSCLSKYGRGAYPNMTTAKHVPSARRWALEVVFEKWECRSSVQTLVAGKTLARQDTVEHFPPGPISGLSSRDFVCVMLLHLTIESCAES